MIQIRIKQTGVLNPPQDCPAEMAQEILVRHVQSIHLGRRNFHYLMSSLVMDDHWDQR